MNERLGIVEERWAFRDAVLSTARMSAQARARVMGRRFCYMPPAPAVEEPKRERRPKKRLGLGPRSGLPARIHQVVITFCKIFQAKVDAVLSCHRSRKVARARQAIAHFLSVEMAMTSSPVGRLLKRDHTTILDSKRVVIGLLDRDAKFSARYHRAVRALRAMWAPQ